MNNLCPGAGELHLNACNLEHLYISSASLHEPFYIKLADEGQQFSSLPSHRIHVSYSLMEALCP